MERLTFEGNFCDIAQCPEIPGGSLCEDGACSQKKVWTRLKAYEDTGLTPEEISLVQGYSRDSGWREMCALTKFENGVVTYVGGGCERIGGSLPAEMSAEQVREVLKLLAAYELTGLSPSMVFPLLHGMEYTMKINMSLMSKFGDALRAEYGEEIPDLLRMADDLYHAQCEELPLPWYEYGRGRKPDNAREEAEAALKEGRS